MPRKWRGHESRYMMWDRATHTPRRVAGLVLAVWYVLTSALEYAREEWYIIQAARRINLS
jgi:hypothetical protein